MRGMKVGIDSVNETLSLMTRLQSLELQLDDSNQKFGLYDTFLLPPNLRYLKAELPETFGADVPMVAEGLQRLSLLQVRTPMLA
jgi:hypothetical protein